MFVLKNIVIFVISILFWNVSHSQSLNIYVIPPAPTTNDSIKIVSRIDVPDDVRLGYNAVWHHDTLKLSACFYNNMGSNYLVYLDTTEVGMLSSGSYIIYLEYLSSSIGGMCSPLMSNYSTAVLNVLPDEVIDKISEPFSVYPNPVSTDLYIKNSEFGIPHRIEITD